MPGRATFALPRLGTRHSPNAQPLTPREGDALPLSYVAKRFGMFLLVVWTATTINFFLPRLGGQDPARAAIMRQAALGGGIQTGMEQMVAEYDEKFGLNKPLYEQYLTYLGDVFRFDFSYSIAQYPRSVLEIIGEAL